jgi:hypothetical protein
VKPRLLDLFESRVERGGGCWEWHGAHNNHGYGQLWHGYRRMVYAHRFAYEAFVGPIPDGFVIYHLCRNTGCCNPSHLEAVSHRVNIKRGRAGTKTACNHGHDWTNPKNVHVRRDGRRWCAACQRERWSKKAKATA